MQAYSMDLRQRVIEAVDEGKRTKWEISLLFKVSPAWIRRLLQRRRETGSIAPRPRSGGAQPKLDDVQCQRLADLVRESPDATLEELTQRLGAPVSRASVGRAVQRLGLTLKKSRSAPVNKTGPMSAKVVKSFSRS
jgi:transposase